VGGAQKGDASLMLGRTKRGGNEVGDASLTLGKTKRGCSARQRGSKGIATLRVASARQQKMPFSNIE